MPRLPVLIALLLPVCLSPPAAPVHAAPAVTVTRLTWHGWPDALRLSNGVVEAIVVPTIGRITSFRLVGHPESDPIFMNRDWAGKTVADADPTTWATFGGDKLWPSPQSEWPKHNVRGWPPDQAFDGDPENARILPNGVRLSTPDSTAFAARATRTLTMEPGEARLYVAQTLTKDPDASNPIGPAVVPVQEAATSAKPDPSIVEANNAAARQRRDGFPIGIWSITQTRGDGTVFLPLAPSDKSPDGYVNLGDPGSTNPAPYFTSEAGLLGATRDPKNAHKVGTAAPDGWMASLYGGRILFSEHFTYEPGAEYPDTGSAAEVYTNASPAYIEMELLGPLVPLTHGDKVTHDVYWQLQRLPRTPKSRADAAALVRAAMR